MWPENNTPSHRAIPDAAKILALSGAWPPGPAAHASGHSIRYKSLTPAITTSMIFQKNMTLPWVLFGTAEKEQRPGDQVDTQTQCADRQQLRDRRDGNPSPHTQQSKINEKYGGKEKTQADEMQRFRCGPHPTVVDHP